MTTTLTLVVQNPSANELKKIKALEATIRSNKKPGEDRVELSLERKSLNE